MKLLRTIRLDSSDTFVFGKAAEPGEWAVSGAFVFCNTDPAALDTKPRAAFRTGFLGVATLGWSTFVQVVEASEADRAAMIEALARQLVTHFGAPDLAAALGAAEEEVAFAESLCTPPADTLIAVERSDDDGDIREAFRTVQSHDPRTPARVFDVLQHEDPEESIDIISLASRERT